MRITGAFDDIPNVPKIQKGIPKKFERQGIDIQRNIKKEWKDIQACLVQPGDVVVGYGWIATVEDIPGSGVKLENVAGDEFITAPEKIVKAFVVVTDG